MCTVGLESVVITIVGIPTKARRTIRIGRIFSVKSALAKKNG